MTDFNALTVPQLKELLKEKDLSTQGLKSDLVERLQQNDKTAEDAPVEEDTQKPVDEPEEAPAKQPEPEGQEQEQVEDVAQEPVSEPAPETTSAAADAAVPEVKETRLSEEEMKKMALDSLNKKLHRCKKFGMEQSQVEALNKMITRVEKFGLDLKSSLAVELGLAKRPEEPAKPLQKNKNKNKKVFRSNKFNSR